MKYCTQCGSACEDSVKFCQECGAQFAEVATTATEATPVASQVAPTETGAASSTVTAATPASSQTTATAASSATCQPAQVVQAQPSQQSWQYQQPGQPINPQQPGQVYATPYNNNTPAPAYQGSARYPMTETDKTLRLIAFIVNIITTVLVCWLIFPLAWMIPMTVVSWGIYKGKRKNTVAFGVCTLLFLDPISGILLLCSTKDE